MAGINVEVIGIGTEISQLFLSGRNYMSLATLVFSYTTLKSHVLPLEHQQPAVTGGQRRIMTSFQESCKKPRLSEVSVILHYI